MTEKKPPDWDNDPLSAFFRDAEYNNRVIALRFQDVYELLGQAHALFQQSEEVTRKADGIERFFARVLMVRSHSSFLAGIRLAMSGQVSESFPVLRSLVESTWYALHIAKDPRGTERSKIWMSRNEDDKAKERCKSEFTVKKVLQTHQALDAATAKEFHKIYEDLIDFGAHPNQLGVMMAMGKTEMDRQVDYSVHIFNPKQLPVLFALKIAVRTAICALKTFQLMFPECFTLIGLDLEIEKLIPQATAIFKSYAPKENEEGTTG